MKNVVSTVVLVLACIILVGLLASAFVRALDEPRVTMSWTTKQCVRVEDPAAKNGEYTCDNLPSTYEIIWVK